MFKVWGCLGIHLSKFRVSEDLQRFWAAYLKGRCQSDYFSWVHISTGKREQGKFSRTLKHAGVKVGNGRIANLKNVSYLCLASSLQTLLQS